MIVLLPLAGPKKLAAAELEKLLQKLFVEVIDDEALAFPLPVLEALWLTLLFPELFIAQKLLAMAKAPAICTTLITGPLLPPLSVS